MIDLDTDPRLTAYVLDELDRGEREIFEQDMANADGDTTELIGEIEEVVKMLDEIYTHEPEYRMTEEQRDAILEGEDGIGDLVLDPGEPLDGKVLPWVVRPTIGKKDKAAVAERLRPSGTRRAGRAIVGVGIAASLVGGLFWMINETLIKSQTMSDEVASIHLEHEVPADGEMKPRSKAFDRSVSPSPPSTAGYSVTHSSVPAATPVVLDDIEDGAAVFDQAQLIAGTGGSAGFGYGSGGGGAAKRSVGNRPGGGGGAPISSEPPTGEEYDRINLGGFKEVLEGKNQLSTFSIDVDTASYANVRRILRSGAMPPAGAVRIEEMINYFSYDYPQPDAQHPFSVNLEVAACPWAKGHRLVRIGLKGRVVEAEERPASNLVFLIDVSGSMQSHDKLPLLKSAMSGLAGQMREQDEVAIVVYASRSGLVLEPTSGANRGEILSAIGRLEAGGSTNGGAGIELAYKVAKQNFIEGGVNRVILATDGDFNVGVTDQDHLVDMVAKRAKDHIFLTVLGFGTGNLNDKLIEEISNRGDGNSHYIDSAREGNKVLVEEMGATLETIAKDVKIQVEFNPAKVDSYRLLGYENRRLRNRDFNNDKIDAGEVGAGHTVTALYEIIPVGVEGAVDPLKYGPEKAARRENDNPELLTAKLRYKQPEATKSTKFEVALIDGQRGWEASTGDFRFAAAVAGFGMLLRSSEFSGDLNYELVKELAGEGMDRDPKGYRKEFLELVERAQKVSPGAP